MELTLYNADTISKSNLETTAMFNKLANKNLIDSVLTSTGEYSSNMDNVVGIPSFDENNKYTGFIEFYMKKDEFSIKISVDGSGMYKAEFSEVNISAGGNVTGGITLVTNNAFSNEEGLNAEEKGKYTISGDSSVMFMDKISGELSIYVKSGCYAKIYVFEDMTLSNAAIKRSAIEIESGAILDLWLDDGVTVNVNSGLGEDVAANTPGKGGYAGIHVPEGATLNLKGEGTVYSYGGNAGSGATTTSSTAGAGGGGAGAGIGRNGGNGGSGVWDGIGKSGKNGENCGNINIYNNIMVYAYGGSGGSGGMGNEAKGTAGGAGGYPAAGIGGGRCRRSR